MNERNVVICDREVRYANALGENISKCENLAVKVYVCSTLDKVKEFLEKKPIHIFIVDENYLYEQRSFVEAGQVFVLGRGRVSDLGDEECQIGKYRCADEIIREIFERYIDKTRENVMRVGTKERARLVAIYSPIHRLGKTTFAMALGKECAKKKRVLYLNLEEYSGMQEEGLNLGDILYYAKQQNGNVGIRLQAAVHKMEQMDYLVPITISQDLKEISPKEWKELLGEIAGSGMYELLILDLSDSVQGLWEILSMCDSIYMPILEDEISICKLSQYHKNLEELQLEKIRRMTHWFVMPSQVEEYAKVRAKEEITC